MYSVQGVKKKHGFFANLPVSGKVAILSGTLIAVAAGLGLVAITASTRIDAALSDYVDVAASEVAALEVDRAFLTTRRYVREYLIGNIAEAHENVAPAAAVLMSGLEQAKAASQGSEMEAPVDDVVKRAGIYLADYEKTSKLKAEQRTLLTATMDGHAEAARSAATLLKADARASGDGEAALLSYTASEASLLVTMEARAAVLGGEAEAAEVRAYRADLDTALTRLEAYPALRDRVAALRTAMASFDQDATAAAELETQLRSLVQGEMKEAAEAIEADISAINAIAAKKEESLKQSAHAISKTAIEVSVTAMAIGLVGGIAFAAVVGRGIARPITRVTVSMSALAGGDLGVDIPGVGRRDEIGRMADTLDVFKQNLAETIRLREEQEAEKRRNEERRRADMLALADRFEATVGTIVDSVSSASTQLQGTAQSMSAGAQQVSGQAIAVAAASEQASANVQTVAGAAEELASAIHEIARQVRESAEVATTAFSQAEATAAQVRELSSSAQKIGEVVSLIETIAGQTNLLALNATIEAARAGETGKGFAVVAAEVKNLATQTAKATGEIASQIAAIQAATATSAASISGINDVIDRMNTISTAISASVDQQGAATKEIARNVQEASTATTEVTRNIEGVTQASEMSAASAAELLGASTDLSNQSARLKQEMSRFLATVRAA